MKIRHLIICLPNLDAKSGRISKEGLLQRFSTTVAVVLYDLKGGPYEIELSRQGSGHRCRNNNIPTTMPRRATLPNIALRDSLAIDCMPFFIFPIYSAPQDENPACHLKKGRNAHIQVNTCRHVHRGPRWAIASREPRRSDPPPPSLAWHCACNLAVSVSGVAEPRSCRSSSKPPMFRPCCDSWREPLTILSREDVTVY
jgi:hypothetical protein